MTTTRRGKTERRPRRRRGVGLGLGPGTHWSGASAAGMSPCQKYRVPFHCHAGPQQVMHWAPQTAFLDWDYKTGLAYAYPDLQQQQCQQQHEQRYIMAAANNTMDGAWNPANAHIKREANAELGGVNGDWYSAMMAGEDYLVSPHAPVQFNAFPPEQTHDAAFWTGPHGNFPVGGFVPEAAESWFGSYNSFPLADSIDPNNNNNNNNNNTTNAYTTTVTSGSNYMDTDGSSFGSFSSAATGLTDPAQMALTTLKGDQDWTTTGMSTGLDAAAGLDMHATPWAPRVRPSQLTVSPQQLRLRPSPTPTVPTTTSSTSSSSNSNSKRTALPDKPRAKKSEPAIPRRARKPSSSTSTSTTTTTVDTWSPSKTSKKAKPRAAPAPEATAPLAPPAPAPSRGVVENTANTNNGQDDEADADDRHRKNMFLVRHKMAGMTYKEIRRAGGFTEAESTLRGRFRTLTKNREERVRRPEWTLTDVRLLEQAVRRLAKPDGGDLATAKIPWKQVAEHMVAHGATYLFGNSTCRKRWDELVEEAVAAGKDINEPFFDRDDVAYGHGHVHGEYTFAGL